ncbi:DNA-binding transcriptional regulator, FadR family [Jiangella sp. DSM 45060]|nr:DNA-binding transcriptional regulator, FadR family [Jiangella sp. DSM 45060]
MRSDQQTFRPVRGVHRRYLQVAFQILQAIGSGQTPLGSRLPSDRDLAELMGVSRLTVREAVLALEVVGILQVRSGDGTYVAHDGTRSSAMGELLTGASFQVPTAEVLEARLAVEPVAVAFTAQRITEAEAAEIEELIDRAAGLAEDVDGLGDFVSLGLEFHALLLQRCRNAHLAAFTTALVDLDEHPLWTLLNAQAVQSVEARHQQVDEHREILRAVREHDADRASALITTHLEHLRDQVYRLSSTFAPQSQPRQ